MKTFNARNAFLCAALFVFAMVGCQNDAGVITPQSETSEFATAEFALYDLEDAMLLVEDATLEHPFGIHPPGFGDGSFPPDGPGEGGPSGSHGRLGHGPQPGRPGAHLGPILRELNLTDEQREQIRDLMAEYHACVEGPLSEFREINREILEQTNGERRAILEALRSGELTREETRAQLQELIERTREAIENNPENAAIQEALCACKLAHFEAIRALLTSEQQAVWDAWVAELDGPCFDETDG